MPLHLNLSPERWVELRAQLDLALAQPASTRAAWVQGLPSSLDDLKPLLARLAQAEPAESVQRLLETLPAVETAQFAPPPARGRASQHVGPYRLLRELGSGGMASVWLAERADMLVRRPVALKLPHGAWHRAGLAERLAREREILATLDHPHIARLYDAGIDGDGQPYLALEVVQGQRIDAYCDAHALDVPARLRLFVQVARAVAHAHANLVVHRDLKPGNVMVTDDGQVKLLDFGIAKLLGPGDAAETDLTRHHGRALTPAYAAPEQLQGQPVTTASDVYSLGVLLYELLCGCRPEPGDGDGERRPPSQRVDADPARRQALRGELDAVVMKALRPAVADRYATAAALADDLDRHLAGEPVLARPERRRERWRRLLRRHRVPAAAGTLAALGLVVGTVVALSQAQQARRAQHRAEDVNRFTTAIFRDASPYQAGRGVPLSGIELLHAARDRLAAAPPQDAGTRVLLQLQLADSLLALEDGDAALALAQRAAEQGRVALGMTHPYTLQARRLQADALRSRERIDEAQQLLDGLLPTLRDSRSAELPPALLTLAQVASRQARFEAAAQAIGEALAVLDRADDLALRVELLATLTHVRRVQGGHGLQALQAADQAQQAALRLRPDQPDHPRVLDVRYERAFVLADLGRIAESMAEFHQVLRGTESQLGASSKRLATRLGASAEVFSEGGQLTDAVAHARRAHRLLGTLAPAGSTVDAARREVLGQALLWARQGDEAARHLGEAEQAFAARFGDTHFNTLIVRRNRALSLAWAGRLDEACPLLAAVRKATTGFARDGYDANAWMAGVCERLSGRAQAARQLQQLALDSLPARHTDPAPRARMLAERGLAELDLGDTLAARASLQQALAAFAARGAGRVTAQADAELGLARLDLSDGAAGEAAARLAEVHAFWLGLDASSVWAAEAAWWRAQAERALGRHTAAQALEQAARDRLRRSPFGRHRALVAAAHP